MPVAECSLRPSPCRRPGLSSHASAQGVACRKITDSKKEKSLFDLKKQKQNKTYKFTLYDIK